MLESSDLEYLIKKLEDSYSEELVKIHKHKKEYLVKANELEKNIYILIDGVIITSLSGVKNKYDFSYLNKPGIVTILGTEEDEFVKQSFDVLVDSDEAHFYQIDRRQFWKTIKSNRRLEKYIRNYYREQVSDNVLKLRQQLSNDRKGQICAFLNTAIELFGTASPDNSEYILIDHKITQETIGRFVGISQRSAVTRIISSLVNDQIIEMKGKSGYITIKDRSYIEKYAK